MNKRNDGAIQAIIFDVGGVLIRTIDHSGRQEWESRLGLPSGGAEAIVLNSEMGHRAQCGEITTESLWTWVGEQLDLGSNLSQFRLDFWRGDSVDQSLVDLARKLRRRYILAIISNAMDSLTETLRDLDLLKEFDLVVGSAYEGIMKPNPAIYELTLNRLGIKPHESVFIDDSPVNVASARAIGMHAVLFNPLMDLPFELQKLGVELN